MIPETIDTTDRVAVIAAIACHYRRLALHIVHTWTRRRTGRAEPEAEDIFHTALAMFFAKKDWPTEIPEIIDRFLSYLKTAWYRTRKQRLVYDFAAPIQADTTPFDPYEPIPDKHVVRDTVDFDDPLIARDLADAIRAGLTTLPQAQHTALMVRHDSETWTTYSRRGYARLRLRRWLWDHGFPEYGVGPVVVPPKACVVCGETFVPPHKNGQRQSTCSKRCFRAVKNETLRRWRERQAAVA